LLGAIGDPAAAPALREATAHPEPSVRAAAISSLGWSGDEGDVPVVARAADDVRPQVRTAARSALADLGGDEAVAALWGALADLDGGE
jgi:HEAT repeat protein